MDKIRKLLSLIGLAKELHAADGGEEVQALKRFAKGLLVGIVAILLDTLAKQTGANCQLGPATCAALSSPYVAPAIAAGLLAAEKYLNEKYGLGVQVLDTTKKTELP